MPIYEYRCPECGARYEISLPVDHKTPSCHFCDETLVIVLHPPALRFDGPGFHCNDYPKGDRHE